jgi:hypothetical protein
MEKQIRNRSFDDLDALREIPHFDDIPGGASVCAGTRTIPSLSVTGP